MRRCNAFWWGNTNLYPFFKYILGSNQLVKNVTLIDMWILILQNRDKWCCVMAHVKRDNTLRVGPLMMNLCANFVKDFASNNSLCFEVNPVFYYKQIIFCHNNIVLLSSVEGLQSPEDLFCGLACFQEYKLRTSGRALQQLSLLSVIHISKQFL